MKSTILVTGGAGYIGSHTAHLMAEQGYAVIILDTMVHNQNFDHSWATLIKHNFADEDVLEKIFTTHKIEAVMHFAACIEVGESVKDPAKFYQNNVVNTLKLLGVMRKHKVNKLIFSSSCATYGAPQKLPLTEDHPQKPISPYGNTKLAVEHILQDFSSAYGLQFVALRYFNAAGALPKENLGEQHEPETHLIPLLLRAANLAKPFYIFGTDYPTKDGTCIRDFLHVCDIADAHAKALSYLQAGNPSDYFNLGTGDGYSVQEIIDTVRNVTGKTINIIHADKRAGDPPVLVANASKAQQVLDWQPHYSGIETIIRTAWEFYCKHNGKILNDVRILRQAQDSLCSS